jgi:hypothetical protein
MISTYVQVIAGKDGDFLDADFRGVRGCTSKSSPLHGHVDTHETQTFAVRQP